MHTQTTTSGTPSTWMKMPTAMQECVQNCINCFQICSHLMDHCLKQGGKQAAPEHIKLLDDCAKICNLSADFMLRHSEFHASVCGACAEVCRACAESCDSGSKEDQMMQTCAQACRKCADSCEQMAKMQ